MFDIDSGRLTGEYSNNFIIGFDLSVPKVPKIRVPSHERATSTSP